MSSSSSPMRRSTVIRPLRRESDRVIRSAVLPATFDNQLKNLAAGETDTEPTWAEGYEAGIEEGMSIGRALTTEEEAAHDRRVRSLCLAIEQAAERAIAEQLGIADMARESLIDTAFALSETLIDRELRYQPRSGEEALRKALSLAPEHMSCVARLNPADIEQLGDVTGRFTHRDLSLVADYTVEVGDCVIDLPAGQIEFRLTDALTRAREVLRSSETGNLPDRHLDSSGEATLALGIGSDHEFGTHEPGMTDTTAAFDEFSDMGLNDMNANDMNANDMNAISESGVER